jgi:hypothetical protein
MVVGLRVVPLYGVYVVIIGASKASTALAGIRVVLAMRIPGSRPS